MADNKDLKKFRGGIRLESTSAPANAETGALYFDSVAKGLKVHDGDQFNDVGSGSSGGLDTFYVEDFRAQTLDVANSGDTKFIRSGSSLTFETDSDEISEKTLKITVGTSATDYLKSPLITLNNRPKGKTCSISFYYKTDSTYVDGDMKLEVYNDSETTELLSVDIKKNTDIKKMVDTFTIPSGASNIHYRFKSTVTNGGSKYLYVDDVEMSQDPFVQADLGTMTDWKKFTPSFPDSSPSDGSTPGEAYTSGGGLTDVDCYWRRVGSNMEINMQIGQLTSGAVPSAMARIAIPEGYEPAANGTSLIHGKTVVGTAYSKQKDSSSGGSQGTVSGGSISPYGANAQNPMLVIVEDPTSVGSTSKPCIRITDNTISTSTGFTSDQWDELQMHSEWGMMLIASIPIKSWESTNTHIVTPAKSNLTDWESFTPVGSLTSASNVTYTGRKRRVGDTMEYQVRLTVGSGGIDSSEGGDVEIGTSAGSFLGDGLIDTNKLSTLEQFHMPFGSFVWETSDANHIHGDVVYSSANVVKLRAFRTTGSYADGGLHFVNGSTLGTTDTSANPGSTAYPADTEIHINFKVPIVGLSSQDSNFLAALPMTKWQKKSLTNKVEDNGNFHDVTGNSDFKFSNLTIGNTYRVSMRARWSTEAADDYSVKVRIYNGSTELGYILDDTVNANATSYETSFTSITFKATDSNVTFVADNMHTNDEFTAGDNHILLEELPMHEETEIW